VFRDEKRYVTFYLLEQKYPQFDTGSNDKKQNIVAYSVILCKVWNYYTYKEKYHVSQHLWLKEKKM